MNMQNEITSPCPLLDDRGHITEEGWARHPYWRYDRTAVKASWLRIKEWDYYYVLSDDLKRGITLTISDLGYAGLMALCWLDFEYNPSNYMAPWQVLDDDMRLNLSFVPIVGRFSGKVVLDDGTGLKLDNFLGFAEDVLNHW